MVHDDSIMVHDDSIMIVIMVNSLIFNSDNGS